jgi:hypothetical protein
MKKNNQQTVIEKIEILDESTGQIILKHRARTIDTENQVILQQKKNKNIKTIFKPFSV